MKRMVLSTVMVVALCLSLCGFASAQGPKVDATVELKTGAVAVGIGWTWGEGVLKFQGKEYPFKVEGLSVVDIGITKAEAEGKVYYLGKIEDFNGIYETVAAEGTLALGAGVTRLRNKTGVMIDLISKTKGVNFKFASAGMKLELKK
jgi:hypothetical protein